MIYIRVIFNPAEIYDTIWIMLNICKNKTVGEGALIKTRNKIN